MYNFCTQKFVYCNFRCAVSPTVSILDIGSLQRTILRVPNDPRGLERLPIKAFFVVFTYKNTAGIVIKNIRRSDIKVNIDNNTTLTRKIVTRFILHKKDIKNVDKL